MQALINRLKKMQNLNLSAVLNKSETREFILRLNRLDQIWIDGERVDGHNIGTYSKTTALLNSGRTFTFGGVSKTKREGGNIFLYDTRYFFISFRVVVSGDSFKIIADDSTGKDTPLSKKYGEIVGLSEESKGKLIEFIRPFLPKELQRIAS